MKTLNPLVAQRVAKAIRPRNPVLAALKNRAAGAGPHRKKGGSLRRAGKIAVARELTCQP